MTRKITLLSVAILFCLLCWYLFIRAYEYKVTFTAKAHPGTIGQTMKIWSKAKFSTGTFQQNSLNSLVHKVSIEDSNFNFDWDIQMLNDSVSHVKVFVSEEGQSLANKILVPFTKTKIEMVSRDLIMDFHKIINEHIGEFRVSVVGKSTIESSYCIYVPLRSTQYGKAARMMENYSFMSTFLQENEIKSNGAPFVEITDWNQQKDSISFNFGFPIEKSDSLPNFPLFDYKWLEKKSAVKAVYNGNYITSDRAWYALAQFARDNNLKTEGFPFEVFYNNPNFGGDELKWRAEVFLPLKNEQL